MFKIGYSEYFCYTPVYPRIEGTTNYFFPLMQYFGSIASLSVLSVGWQSSSPRAVCRDRTAPCRQDAALLILDGGPNAEPRSMDQGARIQ